MALDFGPLVRAVVDLGSESYEARVRRLILLSAGCLLALVLVFKMRIK